MERDKDFEKYLEKLGVPPMTEEQKRNLQGIYDGSYKGKDKPGEVGMVGETYGEREERIGKGIQEGLDRLQRERRQNRDLGFACSNRELWNKIEEKNQDRFGQDVFLFAERWARSIETKMKKGSDLAVAAEESKKDTDVLGGMDGAGFGRAVKLLAETWVHGDEPLKWYESETTKD